MCAAGYGSYSATGTPTCTECAADTYGPKGATAACSACDAGLVSAAKSDGAGDCYSKWQDLQKDYDFLPVNSASMMTPGAANTLAGCEAECDGNATCIFYQFDSNSNGCSLYFEPVGTGSVEVGFKIDTGVYAVIPGNADSTYLGTPISAPTSTSIRNCVHECDKVEGCVVLVITENGPNDFTCGMKSGALSADLKTKYKVAGADIAAWSL